ncbi:MAG: Mov34/MPN/PAD-1 family protein [Chlorobiaceae bacterium]
MRIFDEVLEAIEFHIARHEPERGGLLFGPINRDVAALFMPDEGARSSSVTYTISREMCRRAPQIERETNLEYKGVVHSHPASLDQPSAGDRSAAANALQLNPHMGKFFMPIVTANREDVRGLRSHELALAEGKLSAFFAERSRSVFGSEVEIRETSLFIVPLRDCLKRVAEHIVANGNCKSAIASTVGSRIFVDEILSLAYSLQCDGHEYIIMGGELFPQGAPNIIYSGLDGETRAVPVRWSINCDPVERIVMALTSSLIDEKCKDKISHLASRFRPGSKRWRRERKKLLKKAREKMKNADHATSKQKRGETL